MSKLMDNLARVLEPGRQGEETKKPSLFVVSRQAPASTPVTGEGLGSRRIVIRSAAIFACAILAVVLFRPTPGARVAPVPPSVPASAPVPGGGGVDLIRAGRLGEAKTALDAFLRANPTSRVARVNHAYVLKELGDLRGAEREYLAVLSDVPADAVALNDLGALYSKEGRFDEAAIALRKAIDADPSYVDAKINLAGVQEARKDWAAALKIFEDLLASPAKLPDTAQVRERVRRLRSLAVGAAAPREKI